jgi:hypothetical protein
MSSIIIIGTKTKQMNLWVVKGGICLLCDITQIDDVYFISQQERCYKIYSLYA